MTELELHCEICDASVNDPGAHYVETKKRPFQDGYWKCHVDLGKWRCAKCDHCWKPKALSKEKFPRCPECGEPNDVFPADDGGWERGAAAQDPNAQHGWDYDGY